jgi:hypothetical protein
MDGLQKILGGQNWDYEIRTALDRADVIVVFISENSVDKRGYAQREIQLALKRHEEKLAGDIFLIPVLLDNVAYPPLLKGLHFLAAADSDFEDQLLLSTREASQKLGDAVANLQEQSDIRWNASEKSDRYNGIPGYSTTISKISFSSTKYVNISEVSDHINGVLVEKVMATRRCALEPDPTLYSLTQSEWSRTNTFDAVLEKVNVVGRVLSVKYSMHWYNAGAAHPIHAPKVFNYICEPLLYLPTFEALFVDRSAFSTVQAATEEALIKSVYQDDPSRADISWIREGTKGWDSFQNFSFEESGIAFQFSSYQVACYAAGMPTVIIPYQRFIEFYTEPVLHALNLYR